MTIHNPHKLSDEKLGKRNGWRFLYTEEIKNRNICLKQQRDSGITITLGMHRKIECWRIKTKKWSKGKRCFRGISLNLTYRTKLSVEKLSLLDNLEIGLVYNLLKY